MLDYVRESDTPWNIGISSFVWSPPGICCGKGILVFESPLINRSFIVAKDVPAKIIRDSIQNSTYFHVVNKEGALVPTV